MLFKSLPYLSNLYPVLDDVGDVAQHTVQQFNEVFAQLRTSMRRYVESGNMSING